MCFCQVSFLIHIEDEISVYAFTNMCAKSLSCVQLFVTLWTVAHQAPLSVYFSRQEYWSGLPFPSQGDLPNPGIEARSPMLQRDSLPSEPLGKAYAFRHLDFSYPVLFR